MKKLCALLALLLLTLAACGGDDGGGEASGDDDGGGDAEAFCERLVDLDEADELDLDEDAAIEAFDELVDLAPDEIDSELQRIQEAFAALTELEEGGDSEDAFTEAFEIILDPALTSALEDFADYAEEECGVEVEGADEFGDLSGDLSSGLTDDLSDDLSDDLTEDDLSPAQRLRAYLDENHPDFSDLASGIGSASVGEGNLQVTLTLDETTDADTAVAICEATLDFAESDEVVEIEVEVEDQEDTVLATGDFGAGCEAA
jgi:hypothetical protein